MCYLERLEWQSVCQICWKGSSTSLHFCNYRFWGKFYKTKLRNQLQKNLRVAIWQIWQIRRSKIAYQLAGYTQWRTCNSIPYFVGYYGPYLWQFSWGYRSWTMRRSWRPPWRHVHHLARGILSIHRILDRFWCSLYLEYCWIVWGCEPVYNLSYPLLLGTAWQAPYPNAHWYRQKGIYCNTVTVISRAIGTFLCYDWISITGI